METKKYKVLIKGSWEGVKEDMWELDEETLKEFGDGNDTVYAICTYENGEPTYMFVAKKVWEKWEEVRKIMSDLTLSPEQRLTAIKKLSE